MNLEKLRKFGVNEEIVRKLHRYGFLSTLPVNSQERRVISAELDALYPDEIPDSTQAGFYRLALDTCEEPLTLGNLIQPRIHTTDQVIFNFLRSTPAQLRHMQENNPRAYARLSREAEAYRQENPPLPSLLDAITPISPNGITLLFHQFARVLYPEGLTALSAYYFDNLTLSKIAENSGHNKNTLRRYFHNAVADVRSQTGLISLLFSYDPCNSVILPDYDDTESESTNNAPPPPVANRELSLLCMAPPRRRLFLYFHNLIFFQRRQNP